MALALAVVIAGCSIAADEMVDDMAASGTVTQAEDPAATPTPNSTNPAATATPFATATAEPTVGADPDTSEDPADSTDNTDNTDSADNTDPSALDLDPSVVGSAGLGDLYYPGYGNSGYDVASYDLVLDWDHDGRFLEGVTTIALTPTQTLQRFNLDFDGLTVRNVLINSDPVAWIREGRELVITADQALPVGQQVQVEVVYDGTPTVLESLGAPFSGGWTDLGETIVVVGEPEGSAGFYPVNEHPTDKATYRFTITTDSELVVAANGLGTAQIDNGDGTTTWVYESDFAQASYLTTIGIGDFVYHEGAPSESGVPVRHWFHEDRYDASVTTMQRTGEMIDAFEAIFGTYPFDVYGALVVDGDLGFALETQTLSVFGGDLVDDAGTFERIVAHELAHQWFGNHVSLGQWRDIWLNEGFATYSEYLWAEAANPGSYNLDATIRNDHEQWGVFLSTPPGAPPADDLFTASVYLRGAFTLHALRLTIGEDAFFSLIRTWVDEHGGSYAETSDFIRLAEDISGQDLSDFFDAWLFASEMPAMPPV